MIKNLFLKTLPFLVILGVTCLIFFKIFLKGLFPIPGDLLVSFYFPWYSGGWEGYDPWTTRKELLGADSIRQIYPWKEFAADQFKKGQTPLWNPYTFSGQPLLANFQSSVFYPLNIFYFITDANNAWILLIVFQPLLSGIFMFLAARSFKLPIFSSIFAAVAFMFSSYLVTWFENGNVGHSYIWLPLAFWSVNRYFELFKFRYLLILLLSLSLSVLGGHPQTAIYIYLTTAIFWIWKLYTGSKNFKYLILGVFVIFGSLTLTAIQLIPTYQFYKNSPISLPFSKEVFDRSIIPLKNLVTFFASDFFGHPANNNFWSQNYGDFTPYFGVVPLIFAFWGIFKLWKNKFIKFATLSSLIFILAAVHGPITYLIKTFQLPILDSTTPSRFISISIFLLIILSAFGFADFLNNFKNQKYLSKFYKFLIPFGGIYLLLWLFATFGKFILEPEDVWRINLAVTRRNLILPTAMFLSIPAGTLAIRVIRERLGIKEDFLRVLAVVGIFLMVLVGGIYYTNKFLPVAPKKFIFPDHLLFNWLKNNAGINRFYGGGTAHIDFNFPAHYQIYGIEGYDTLRLERYAQLLASSFTGEVPKSYLRSDGVVENVENGYRKRVFELLGVKYLLDKEDNPKTDADWHYERFAGDNVKGIWQADKFQVYERSPVLPRYFLTTKYIVAKDDRAIIEKIYDDDFNLETLILEEEPSLKIIDEGSGITIPQIIKYEPNEVIFATNTDYNSLLFLSDAYDRDWQVYIDGQKTKLLRAHYALRSVAVPNGSYQVTFKYQSKSFTQGLLVTASSVVTLFVISLFFIKKKRL